MEKVKSMNWLFCTKCTEKPFTDCTLWYYKITGTVINIEPGSILGTSRSRGGKYLKFSLVLHEQRYGHFKHCEQTSGFFQSCRSNVFIVPRSFWPYSHYVQMWILWSKLQCLLKIGNKFTVWHCEKSIQIPSVCRMAADNA